MPTPILETLRKLDERSKKLKLVEYTENSYKLWNEKEWKIVTRRDVIFNKIMETKEINESQEIEL